MPHPNTHTVSIRQLKVNAAAELTYLQLGDTVVVHPEEGGR